MDRITRTSLAAALAATAALGVLSTAPAAHADTAAADVTARITSPDANLLTPGKEFRLWLNADVRGGTVSGLRLRATLPRGVALTELAFNDYGAHWGCDASRGRKIDCTLQGDFTPNPNPQPMDPAPDGIELHLKATQQIKAGEARFPVTLTTTSTDPNPADNATSVTLPVSTTYGSVAGRVWRDLNQNGLQDKGEPGIADVEVSLWEEPGPQPNMSPFRTTTDAEGRYHFDRVPAYTWSLSLWTQTTMDHRISPPNVGTDDTIDSDFIQSEWGTVSSPTFTVAKHRTTVLDGGWAYLP